MKRDLDLIRKILLAVEEQQNLYAFNDVQELAQKIKNDNIEIVGYHVSLLQDCNYIEVEDIGCCGEEYDNYSIKRLTAFGCDYLDSVRDEAIWQKVKAKLIPIGGTAALELVKELAGKIILTQLS